MGRIKIIFRSIFSAFMGKQEVKHAREILDLGYEDMLDLLVSVKRDVADVATSKHRITQLVERNRAEAEGLDKIALAFLERGDETKATQALEKKAYVLQQLTTLETQAASIAERQVDLEASQAQLETRIEQFKSEKEMLKARLSAAEATARIGETTTGISKEAMDIGKTVGRLREKADDLEARGGALKELIATGTLDDMFSPGMTPLSRASEQLERDASVAADLDRLRKQLPAKAS